MTARSTTADTAPRPTVWDVGRGHGEHPGDQSPRPNSRCWIHARTGEAPGHKTAQRVVNDVVLRIVVARAVVEAQQIAASAQHQVLRHAGVVVAVQLDIAVAVLRVDRVQRWVCLDFDARTGRRMPAGNVREHFVGRATDVRVFLKTAIDDGRGARR